uniref:Uncharacterized protein n=1 Tax=Maylandia zebra TaxID=106582 RepID=A0A3P9CED7_9CICH
MPYLTDLDRSCAIGQLQAGVLPSIISKLKTEFQIMGDVTGRPQSGCSKKMTPQDDWFLTLSALRSNTETIWNRLHTANVPTHRAARRPTMTTLHHQACLRCCQKQRWATSIIQSSKQDQTRVNSRLSCLALAGKIWQVFLWAQSAYSVLLLNLHTHFP